MSCSADKAAHFIYLNRMCFNGIYRVNRSGEFNVPFGGKSNPGFPEFEALSNCSQVLRSAQLRTADFGEVLGLACSGDIVYLDPPYLPLNGTSYFRHYTKHRFNLKDHQRLAEAVHELASGGVNVVITVGDSPEIRRLYTQMEIEVLSIRRYVGSNGDRKLVRELILASSR
jgi:DNA adenine methylase